MSSFIKCCLASSVLARVTSFIDSFKFEQLDEHVNELVAGALKREFIRLRFALEGVRFSDVRRRNHELLPVVHRHFDRLRVLLDLVEVDRFILSHGDPLKQIDAKFRDFHH